MFIRYAAFHLQQLSAKRQTKTSDQKSIEVNKENDKKEISKETEKETNVDKSQEDDKDKKQKKDKPETDKKDAKPTNTAKEVEAKGDKEKEEDLLLNENYSEIDTDVAKKIVESITDSICSGDKQESDCKLLLFLTTIS